MAHLAPDELALRALGEQTGSPADEGHLRRCPLCRDDLAELSEIVDRARGLDEDERRLPPPPAGLWERIAADVGSDLNGSGPAAPADGGLTRPQGPTAGRVVELPARWRLREWPMLGATAAALVIFAVIAAAVLQNTPTEPSPVGVAALEPLDDRAEAARARIIEEDGELVLHLDNETALPEIDGYYELWLIDEGVTGMVSLGPLDGVRGHRLPAGLDPSSFPVVDVSRESFDGDPAHSGDSLLRGILDLEP